MTRPLKVSAGRRVGLTGCEAETSFLIVVVFDPVAVRAQDNALGDLPHDCLAGEAATDHVGYVKVFFLVVGVVELKGSVVSETTPHAPKSLLVIVQPQPQCSAALIGFRTLAALTPQPTISLAIDDPANFKRLTGLLGVAVLARRHGSSC
jgi:hypothetical protein